VPVRTYQDAVEHLTDHFDVDRAFRLQRNIRRAVEEAYRDLPQQGYWAYYRRHAVINTVASQTTGTITYTHATRIITLAGATFPAAAAKYRIIIANVHYDIESYTDSTHVVLPAASNPGADVAAGTAYTLYKNEYVLPTTFRRALGLVDTSNRRPVRIVTDAEEQSLQYGSRGTPGTPVFVCIRNTGETTGGLSLVFNCPPNAAVSYDLLFDATPRAFVLPEKYSTGTVSITSGLTALTGSGTTFPSTCAGCVIRLSENAADEPTGAVGARIDDQDVDNPYSFQTFVQTYASAAALTLLDAATATYTAVKYSLSDPLDIEDGAMLTAFWRMAEANYARMARMEATVIDRYMVEARNAVILAKENDGRFVGQQNPKSFDYLPGTVTNANSV
jgi:hypothetical protein